MKTLPFYDFKNRDYFITEDTLADKCGCRVSSAAGGPNGETPNPTYLLKMNGGEAIQTI